MNHERIIDILAAVAAREYDIRQPYEEMSDQCKEQWRQVVRVVLKELLGFNF